MRHARTVFVLLACVIGCYLPVLGQATTSLRGHVTDSSGAAISGARCELTLSATGAVREGKTDNTGEYQFAQLPPGEYSLKVSEQGFAGVEKRGMNLLVGQPATEDVILSVANVTQDVKVEVDVQPMLNTTDATLGNAFSQEHIEALPIEGRNVPDLLSLQPGVTFLGRTDSNNGTNSVGNSASDSRSGSVNGGHSDQSNITLDGVDVNDINFGYAFSSVLRVTQDSISEFRVTTSNPDAAEGRSSGAQVGLITKSGTNHIHGAAYEYNRSSLFEANSFFNKQQQLDSGQANRPPKLIRNVFGASIGGPILHDHLFYFANYEGRRDAEGESVYAGTVPTPSLRAGNIQYENASGSITTLTPAQIQAMDPQGIGVNQNVLAIFANFPQPNDPSQGDSLNTQGYRFPYNVHRSYNTYIGRFDWNITGKQSIFWRGNLQNDDEPSTPAFPGQPPSTRLLTNNKGLALGYTAIITPNLVNAIRYGFTRQGVENAGLSNQPEVSFNGIAAPQAFSRSIALIIPLHNVVDDLSWTKHDHSFQFGTNLRFIDDQRTSNANSFPDGQMNAGWLANGSTVAGNGGAFDPAAYGYPAVSKSFRNRYNDALLSDVGIITEGDAVYNYTKEGTALPLGTPLKRDYRWNEYEFYAQDSWKALKNLTITYGVRYSLLQPPAEASGTQVGTCKLSAGACTPYALTDYFLGSASQAAQGGSANAVGEIGFDLNGRANGKPDFWNMEKKDIGPRIAFAYSPDAREGFLNRLFGDGKSSIRAGYSMVFDHFGAATVNTFDTTGSFGLSSQISNVPGSVEVGTAPRFTDLNTIPAEVVPAAPQGGFPAVPDSSLFAISWGMDSKIKTPYSHLLDFSIARQLRNGSSLEIAYVGRLAHRLLAQEDVAMPINLRAGGSSYFAEAAQMSKLVRAGTDVGSVAPNPYWEQLFGALDNVDLGYGAGPASATQNVYQVFQQNLYNETYALFSLDLPDSQTGAGINPDGAYPSYRFYHDQYSALYAWRSIAYSNYHALQVVYRQQIGSGLFADLNYTYSKSMDIASQSERLSTAGSNNNAQIINTWAPNQLYGVSDYDATHQMNANYVWDIPVGHGRHFLGTANRLVDAVLGGWQTTGIVRWTSGLPFAVNEGGNWPTNWDIEGWATQVTKIPKRAAARGHLAQRFADPQAVFAAFDYTLPGDSGTRNPLRGDGYYDWDAGLNKSFPITEHTRLQVRWETFNVTNSVRFDSHSINSSLDNATNFGNATVLLTDQRKAQLAARFEF
jgi:carboxypeptidase family protein